MILNLLSLNTAWNREKVVEFLENREVDLVFLDLPAYFEPYLARNTFPPVDVTYAQDFRASEPIIQYCWNKKIPVYCYLDDKFSEEQKKLQFEFAKLVLKSKIAGKIDVLEWKNLLFTDLKLSSSSSEFVAMKIIERAKGTSACLNLSPEVEKYLKEEGFEVERVRLYDFQRPIDRLYELALREMQGEKIEDGSYLELIKAHLVFIDTVMEVGYEEACKYRWL